MGTVVPTTQPDTVRSLVKSGMDVLRVNLAHSNTSSLNSVIAEYRAACREQARVPCVLCELRGGEIRSCWFIDKELGNPCDSVSLHEGQQVKLVSHSDLGREKFTGWSTKEETRIGIGLERLGSISGELGTMIWMSDGNCKIRVTGKLSETEVLGVVTTDCTLVSHAKVFIKRRNARMPFLSTQDMADLKWVVQNSIDFVAVPLTRNESDVEELRDALNRCQGGDVRCVVSPPSAVSVMLCRSVLSVSFYAMQHHCKD